MDETPEYPKWVQREPHIGAVLCLNADEESQLIADWKAQKRKSRKAATDETEAPADPVAAAE